ncbi:MAG TPA: hypothetical protein VIL64_02270 [Solirubrobacteraceae bacterium]
MTALLAVKAAVAATLALSIGAAFFGPAPRCSRARLVRPCAWLAGAMYAFALAMASQGDPTAASMTVAAAVEVMCLAVWLSRWRGEELREPDEPESDPPVDWVEFDRLRDGWTRPRDPRPLEPVA